MTETLLVDDSAIVRAHLSRLLSARGHGVVAVDDAESALVQCQVRQFQLIVLDWQLPGMDGVTLCQRIRELPHGDFSVILFLTGREDPHSLAIALEAGANDYITKSAGAAAIDVRLTVAEQQVEERVRRRLAESALRKERDALQGLMDTMPDLIYFKDMQSRYIRINRALARFLKIGSPEQAIGKTDFDFYPRADATEYFANEQRMLAGGPSIINQYEDSSGLRGEECWTLATKVPFLEEGRMIGLVGISRDVTAERRAEAAIRHSEAHFRQLIELAPVGAYIIDDRGIYETVNVAYAAMLGYTPAELQGQHFGMVVPSELRESFDTLFQQTMDAPTQLQAERTGLTKAGVAVTLLLSSMPLLGPDQRRKRAYFVSDITERKHAERRLAELAHFDRLTGLANRTLFVQRLDEAIHRIEGRATLLAVLFIDLDGFKAINDTHGHAAGDLVLQSAAQRLTECVRETDLVARLGGDEFTVLLPAVRGYSTAARVAQNMLDALGETLHVRNLALVISGSIGIALCPSDAGDREGLLGLADGAMYAAKSAGKNRFAFANLLSPVAPRALPP